MSSEKKNDLESEDLENQKEQPNADSIEIKLLHIHPYLVLLIAYLPQQILDTYISHVTNAAQ